MNGRQWAATSAATRAGEGTREGTASASLGVASRTSVWPAGNRATGACCWRVEVGAGEEQGDVHALPPSLPLRERHGESAPDWALLALGMDCCTSTVEEVTFSSSSSSSLGCTSCRGQLRSECCCALTVGGGADAVGPDACAPQAAGRHHVVNGMLPSVEHHQSQRADLGGDCFGSSRGHPLHHPREPCSRLSDWSAARTIRMHECASDACCRMEM